MMSIDKLHYTFLAGLSHDKWDMMNDVHDAAKFFESFVSCEFVAHRKPEATSAFPSQNNETSIFKPLSGTPGNPWDLS